MFARAIGFATLALPIFAAASDITARNDCDTGSVQCCASLQSARLADALASAGLLGVSIEAILGNVNGLVGLACVPLSLISLSGNSCSTQPVCCSNNFLSGLIQAGCNPVNVNL
ncbi:hydrophobin-315 [Flammula alnicola]|nr:hydrophobin-315 [Flammula alnicola]